MIHVLGELVIALAVASYFSVMYMKPREVSIRRLILIPAVVLYFALTTLHSANMDNIILFAAMLMLGVSLGYLNVRHKDLRVDKNRLTIGIPREPEMAIYLLFIVLFKFAVGYSVGAHLAISHTTYFQTVVTMFTGILAGYCSGRHGYYAYILTWSTKQPYATSCDKESLDN